MSTQSIRENSISRLLKEAIDSIKDNSKKMLLKDRFRLGKGMCETQQQHFLKICNIIQKNNCELNSYLIEILEQGPKCYEVEALEDL